VALPYISEIRIMSFGFAPRGWAQCNGQLVPISQNVPLFSLIGTTYGGDGVNTFGLPNLQGRTPVSFAAGYNLGSIGGEQSHVLTVGEEPTHTHTALGTSTGGDSPVPAGNYLGAADSTYGPLVNATPLQAATIANAGGSQPHNNMQPYLVLNFCIALVGVFPTQN
jgi:microcystin-dependent protein